MKGHKKRLSACPSPSNFAQYLLRSMDLKDDGTTAGRRSRGRSRGIEERDTRMRKREKKEWMDFNKTDRYRMEKEA